MSNKGEVFKCEHCNTIVAVLKGGKSSLNCCERQMSEVTPDEGKRWIYDLQRPGSP